MLLQKDVLTYNTGPVAMDELMGMYLTCTELTYCWMCVVVVLPSVLFKFVNHSHRPCTLHPLKYAPCMQHDGFKAEPTEP